LELPHFLSLLVELQKRTSVLQWELKLLKPVNRSL